ncbi:cyclic 2,3-diphosphoglycerate synthetase [Geobacter sp. OR-1]|uniref:cyclic 2,3-diphosphoglycerate synthase n=1 Tax=Geobacter sp. OR-1 TaxID=1266765 RepID=UPI0005441B83|nr:tetraacyldisaccharide 4'-kinase [Geobacter sp. OR-1]GAM11611.1 cyclic 2,3-diphosphoglycerate synthetase [Geobacter sp. OR-1]
MKRKRVIIMGAAGRDFHNFNCCFRNNESFRVVAFTATQIPYISGRRYPAVLAGSLYPAGIPIYPEEQLLELIRRLKAEQIVFAYSDVSHENLMHKASTVLASGADFCLLGPDATMLKSRLPVISVCAIRTGCGKSQVVRYLCDILREKGIRPMVVRHPMPYGNLSEQAVERFADVGDLDRFHCTIEEREEYEHLLEHGATVYAGVDYHRILRQIEKEAAVIIWDGGNNDLPFFRPDLEIVVVDPLRPGHETAWYPGEVNLRRADLLVINKVNAVEPSVVSALMNTVHNVNPAAKLVRTASEITVEDGERIRGKNVLVIEDGPTITHGSMPSGAGLAAAIRYGAAAVIDPRPWVQGSLRDVYNAFPHIGPVLPALGYSSVQVADLAATVAAVPCDLVLAATPIDLKRLFETTRPVLRVSYDIAEESDLPLKSAVLAFLAGLGRS